MNLRRTLLRVCRPLAWGVLLAGMAAAQRQSSVPPPATAPPVETDHSWEDRQRPRLEKEYNQQRQEEIKKDTDKLLQLATELKGAVDKSNEHTLSLDVVKKAEQIEKLARSVKDKMKGP